MGQHQNLWMKFQSHLQYIINSLIDDSDYQTVSSLKELKDLFHFAFQNGVALERQIVDFDLCQQIGLAVDSTNPTTSLGGNALIMAKHFHHLGASLTYGFQPGPLLTQLINAAGMSVPPSEEQDEDIPHYILEYSRGEQWGNMKTPRSNRLIIHCDRTNSRMTGIERFTKILRRQHTDGKLANWVVISGFHLLEEESVAHRVNRLRLLRNHLLQQLPSTASVHLELASCVSSSLPQLSLI